jgi:hypothetical protein
LIGEALDQTMAEIEARMETKVRKGYQQEDCLSYEFAPESRFMAVSPIERNRAPITQRLELPSRSAYHGLASEARSKK